jgi:hypothetical protein
MNIEIQNQIQAALENQTFKVGDEWVISPTVFTPNEEDDFYELTVLVSRGSSSDWVQVYLGFRGLNAPGFKGYDDFGVLDCKERERCFDYDFEFMVGNGDWASPLEMYEALGAAITWLRQQEWYKQLSICGEIHK